MRRIDWVALILALPLLAAVPADAAAPAPAASYPQPVADWLDKARQDCPGGFASQPGVVRSFDLTGTGAPSYVIDPHFLSCAQEPHLYVGDGPASIELFVTLPSGRVVHTGGVVAMGYRVVPNTGGGAPVIAFDSHDANERAGSVDSYRWDGQNFALLTKSSMAVPPLD